MDVLSTGLETAVGHDPLLQRDVGLDAVHHHFTERHLHARDRGGAVGRVHDELADHRVVVRRHPIPFVDVRIHAHAGAAGGVEMLDQAGRGHEGVGVFGVDAALDGVAAQHDIALADRQLVAGGDHQLFLHQIDAGDQFGDRMFHLDAGVHFDEVEAAVFVQELEGAGAAVADAHAGFGADLADLGALLGGDARRGRFLDDLLVPALHRTIAFAQMDRVALAVGQHLDLDVARVLQELLHVDLFVAERGLGFALGGLDGGVQRSLGVHHAHTAPAAAARGLDDDRVADLAGDADVLLGVVAQRAAAAGHAGHARGLHRADRFDLVAHHADGLGARADEDEAGAFDAFGEIRVLAEEAVARMDRLGVGHFGGGDDRRHVEVAVLGRGGADADRFVGHRHVFEVAVDGGMHRDRLDAERMTRAQNAQRDLAPVGDHHFIQHGGALSRSRRGAGRTRRAGRSRTGSRARCRTRRLRSG